MKRVWILLAGLGLTIASMPETGWTQVTNATEVESVEYRWPDSLAGTSTNVKSILVHDGNIFTGTFGENILTTSDTGKTWAERGINLNLFLNLVIQIISADSGVMFAGGNEWISRSIDGGMTWARWKDIRSNIIVSSLFRSKEGSLFALGRGVLRSSDNGWTWDKVVDSALAWPWASSLTQTSRGTIIIGLDGSSVPSSGKGILRSTDGGNSFVRSDSGFVGHDDIESLAYDSAGATVYAATYDNGLWVSKDDGITWSQVGGLPSPLFFSVFVSPNLGVFTGFGGGKGVPLMLYRSTDGGLTWSEIIQFRKRWAISYAQLSDSLLLVGTEDGMFLVTFGNVTGVEKEKISAPETFKLSQNYPNPFNPSTSIRYTVASIQHVSLTVYDVLGREIVTLVNEVKPAGEYEAVFNASSLPSGTYFYRLTAGNFTETRKMALVK